MQVIENKLFQRIFVVFTEGEKWVYSALGAGGRRFESFCPDNENQGVTKVTPFFVCIFTHFYHTRSEEMEIARR